MGLALALAVACTPILAQEGGTVRVSTRADLDAALEAAAGGETILLAPGDYGELVTGLDFAETVTIRSEEHLGATFSRLGFEGASGLAVERMTVTEGLPVMGGSSRIAIRQVDLGGNLYLRDASDVVIEDSHIHGGRFGIVLNNVQGFVVRGNDVSETTEDLMRVTGDSSGLIEGNVIHDPNPSRRVHPDAIQLFGSNGATKVTPHDVTIRRNHIHALSDEDSGGAQGIFVTDPRTSTGYRNILIEENLIQVHLPNALLISGGVENVRVLNNTLIPNGGDGSAIIRLVGTGEIENAGVTVEGNVMKQLLDESRASTIGDNYVYGRGAPLTWIFTAVDGRDWRSFAPVPRTRIDFGSGYGAEAFLADLIAGRARLGPSWTRD